MIKGYIGLQVLSNAKCKNESESKIQKTRSQNRIHCDTNILSVDMNILITMVLYNTKGGRDAK